MDFFEEKCDKLPDFILKRETERKLQIDKRKETKNQNSTSNENIDLFEKIFKEKKNEIETSLQETRNSPLGKLPQLFDEISKKIQNLQKYVAASNIFLRSYDVKVCHESLHNLTLKSKKLEEELIPKKKFGFSRKNKEQKTAHAVDEVDTTIRTQKVDLGMNFYGFENLTGETLTMDSNINKKDVSLKNLNNCTIKLIGNASTLHISQLTNCMIISGPVSTSVFIENCSFCHLIVACQQLRLHNSNNIKLYLHVTSRAIIEDSKEISVAPYNLQYNGIDKDFETSGLDRNINNWQLIDDFNWLNTERKSPNWSIMETCDQSRKWEL